MRTQIEIGAKKFGFMPGIGTFGAIFILQEVHAKYLRKHKDIYFTFVDLEIAFDHMPRKVLCCDELWWNFVLKNNSQELYVHKASFVHKY